MLLAPILSFTAEEAWQSLDPALRGAAESAFDLSLPPVVPVDDAGVATWGLLKKLRAEVAANEGLRDFQLDAAVAVEAPFYERLLALGDGLREALVVSALRDVCVAAGDASQVTVFPAAGAKCQRCWKYLPLGTDPAHPTLDATCAAIVRAWEASA